MKVIALEESFWYEKLATEGSTVAHVRVKSAVAADWQRKLVVPEIGRASCRERV